MTAEPPNCRTAELRAGRCLCIVTAIAMGCVSAFACQPCTLVELQGNHVRIVQAPIPVGKQEVVLRGARVRILSTRKANNQGTQRIGCLAAYEPGNVVWSGRTNKRGQVRLEQVPAGTYYFAVKGETAEAVYVLALPEIAKRKGESTLVAANGGLVNNNCGIEPIGDFFR